MRVSARSELCNGRALRSAACVTRSHAIRCNTPKRQSLLQAAGAGQPDQFRHSKTAEIGSAGKQKVCGPHCVGVSWDLVHSPHAWRCLDPATGRQCVRLKLAVALGPRAQGLVQRKVLTCSDEAVGALRSAAAAASPPLRPDPSAACMAPGRGDPGHGAGHRVKSAGLCRVLDDDQQPLEACKAPACAMHARAAAVYVKDRWQGAVQKRSAVPVRSAACMSGNAFLLQLPDYVMPAS